MFAVYDEKDCDNPELCMPIMVNFYAINGECMNYNSWKNNKLVINNKRTLKIKNLTKDQLSFFISKIFTIFALIN